MRDGLARGLGDWSSELGFALPRPAREVATQVIALLVGLALQHRLDPAVVPRPLVIAGLRRLLDLPVATRSFGGSAPDRPTT